MNSWSFPLDSLKFVVQLLKKIISIAFVLIILLNTMGYYGVFIGLHFKNDLKVSRALDADIYDQSSTITIKVPVSIPYMLDQPDFSRVNGQFEHNGELYRKIKQRYANDTLTVLCLKDTEHKQIDLALTDYVKTFSDSTQDNKATFKLAISFIKDYLPSFFEINSATSGWALPVEHNSYYQSLISNFSISIIHPPERA